MQRRISKPNLFVFLENLLKTDRCVLANIYVSSEIIIKFHKCITKELPNEVLRTLLLLQQALQFQ